MSLKVGFLPSRDPDNPVQMGSILGFPKINQINSYTIFQNNREKRDLESYIVDSKIAIGIDCDHYFRDCNLIRQHSLEIKILKFLRILPT